MDQLSIQSYQPSDKPQAYEVLGDLITAIEFVMQRRPKAVRALLLEATQVRVARIQQRIRRRVCQ
jgi:hypothetical protein